MRTSDRFDRRAFLAGSTSLALLPHARLIAGPPGATKRLVVVELAGGNDGLNTVVPRDDRDYLRARPRLAIKTGLRALDDRFGLHPSLEGLAKLHARGELATLLAVGYPKPDRSHFRSMDIWQSARPDLEQPQLGWLGLAADELARRGVAYPALALGMRERPLALQAREVVIPALRRLEEYRLFEESRVGAEERLATLDTLARGRDGDDALDRLLKDTARTAYAGSRELRRATRTFRPVAKFGSDAFGSRCELAARALVAPLGLRVVWLRQGGYDTHAGQLRTHGALLASLDRGLSALAAELRARKIWKSTRVLVFSEFGRRVAENRSRGTDHGAAGPAFVLGGGVAGGVHGDAPSLVRLDRGDLRHGLDFRRLYAEILEDWLDVDPKRVLDPSQNWSRARTRVLRAT